MTKTTIPKALIVDDNPFNRRVLNIGLLNEGFEVEEGRNGKEALSFVMKTTYDLIFMDLLMPGLTGFETIERIRYMGIMTPIIIISSMTSREDRKKCLEVGGNDFLAKPITPDTIKELIQKFRDNRMLITKPQEVLQPQKPAIQFSDYSVLVVEADESFASNIMIWLKRLEFDAEVVAGGEEAWSRLTASIKRADVVITNLFTPDIDGLGLCVRLKQNYPEILVIIYAQDYDPETRTLAAELGADGFVDQTVLEAEIQQVIESALVKSAKKGSRTQTASTARQVRKAQEHLIRFGCAVPCETIDIGYVSLTDAGGDMACCRRFNHAGRCGIFLGDISGHDVMASYLSAMSLGILSSIWNQHQNPVDLINTMNTELCRSGYDNYHLCALALLWDRIRRRALAASAGNPGVIIVSENHAGIEEYDGGGLCLGLLPENQLFINYEISINDNSLLIIHSDGIDKQDILELLHTGQVSIKKDSIRGLCDEILSRILDKQNQHDDMILIILKQTRLVDSLGIHQAFPSNYKAVDEACEWVESVLIQQQIPVAQDIDLILLAIREALINAVKYGNCFKQNCWIDISLFNDTNLLKVEISDQGQGFTIPPDIKKIDDLSILQMGGRGLSTMAAIADTLDVEGSTLIMTFFHKNL